MSLTIETWVSQEHLSFRSFNAVMAGRLEEAIYRAMGEALRIQVEANETGTLQLPWGTYTANMKSKGENTTLAVEWAPSDEFIDALQGDVTLRVHNSSQDTFDENFSKAFAEWATYGELNPDKSEDPNKALRRGLRIDSSTNADVEFFTNSYGDVLATIAKDKALDGKNFRLEINAGMNMGAFIFDYKNDEISPSFVPSRAFTQLIKEDVT